MCDTPSHAPEYISIPDIARAWERNGGDPAHTATMTALTLPESGQDRYALSPDCAVGLWQILESYIEADRGSGELLWNIDTNAAYAVALSKNGTELAPWDVAYANVERAAQRYHLSDPEAGSPAARALPTVIAALSGSAIPGTGPGQGVGPVTPGQQGPIPGVGPGTSGGGGGGSASVVVPATHPQYIPTGAINPPGASGSGWDDLRQYWGSDQRDLQQLLSGLRTRLQTIFSGG